ncbi:MAG: hypothetical protein WA919_13730 [Coleofasciculaceae cyanobacterium]
MLKLQTSLATFLIAVLSSTPALSEDSNFGEVSLAPGFPPGSVQVVGHTGGNYPLTSIANRDSNNKPCYGYGDETPDHIIVLEQNFSNFSLLVNSGGENTTLVVKSPDGKFYCGDDTGPSEDASVRGLDLSAGTYKVWVGSVEAGQNWNYTLTVQE